MTRQYNTIFYNTVKKIQKIHLLRNSNTIEVIKHSISYIISRCTNKDIKFTMAALFYSPVDFTDASDLHQTVVKFIG